MRFREVFRFAFAGLKANKLRSSLTTLGILIGVGAVILLVAVGKGSGAQVQANIDKLGTNLLEVSRQAGGFGARASRNTGTQSSVGALTLADAQALVDPVNAPDVLDEAPVVTASPTATYEGATHPIAQLVGTYPAYLTATNWTIAEGSSITDDDVAQARKVIVIGQTVATDLFNTADPVGQQVMINSVPYTVEGVLQSKGSSGLQDADDFAIAPLTTVQDSLSGFGSLSQIVVQAKSAGATTAAQDEITSILTARHHLAATASPDFRVLNQQSLLATSNSTTHTFTVLLGAVAAISLLVGGIGITNIMLVTVTERTREIGIRKALGAPRAAILGQFLIEAVLLSLIGGALGVAAGLIGTRFTVAGVKPVIVPASIALAFAVSALIGLFFGSFPANRAAKLHPIQALRHE
ncbi:putative ABC transport system permease protein [Catenulispora sp. GP43]|uniref:ABC transporter permease n=1 Tax=Catenulispora sp. GP43 TaxID=3156263 RepID=UPI0035146622